ncbi:MAG: amidase [Gammaproteobacteria bacterium]|nr:amidase [Gammaproteobacteria bacterium]
MRAIQRPLHHRSLVELGEMLRTREITSTELVEHFLQRISRLDPVLNAFRVVCAERARAEATAADAMLEQGISLGPLHGLPYAVKDLFDVQGLPTSAGCRLLEQSIKQSDCAVVARLRAAGMVLLGKTNTVQFAFGGAGINHHHGTPHNPWQARAHLPGGSSSGSAVAVAAGLAPMALGSDTGGSVRIPAALCGITGLKTTVGRVSRHGVYPLSQTLDSVGPLCRDAIDSALVFDVIQGEDPADPSTMGKRRQNSLRLSEGGLRGLRLAVAEGAFFDGVRSEAEARVREAADTLRGMGANVTSLRFEEAELALQANAGGLVIAAEAYSNNRRLVDEQFDALDPVVAHRLVKGRDVRAVDYLQTIEAWRTLRARTLHELRDVDVLLCPSTLSPALPVDEVDASIESYSSANLGTLRNTSIGNVLNLCGLSVPCGFSDGGLPTGLMLYAKPDDEHLALRVARAFQLETDWHQRTPGLDWVGT